MTHKKINKYFKIKKPLIAAVKEIEKKMKIAGLKGTSPMNKEQVLLHQFSSDFI